MQPLSILGMHVNPTSYTQAVQQIRDWSKGAESRYICVASVNNVMEAYDSQEFLRVMNEADLVTPDGMPLVWALRLLGHRSATRVYGPDLTPLVFEMAEREGLPVGFYGGAPAVLDRLVAVVRNRFPRLMIQYACSPPFHALSEEEDVDIVSEINQSQVRILFVGLNTPKQDLWMRSHRGRVNCVMLGVGAAFDFFAGAKKQAPRWLMPLGLEWLFRLCTEPRRLWRRYLKHNPRFVALFAAQLARARVGKDPQLG
jgi:N-acetylglucosaminyldiphosphoundecaprenol N-acetyl-beta-D-mannosaminyltransferase